MSDLVTPPREPTPTPTPATPTPTRFEVPALYSPKSVTCKDEGDGTYLVRIRTHPIAAYFLAIFTIPFLFLVMPVMAIMGRGQGAFILFLLAIGVVVFMFLKGASPMRISPAGVEVSGYLYRMEDAAGFRTQVDNAWLIQITGRFGLRPLGLQYGIYSVRLPYVLPEGEATKVAPYLTDLLKSVARDIGKERERKIQQAQEF